MFRKKPPPLGLGRIVSPPDHRDYGLSQLLTVTSDSTLRDQAVAELKQTTISGVNYFFNPSRLGHWHNAMGYLTQIGGVIPPPAGDVVWTDAETVLDQGNYGTCVGNGCAQWGNTLPFDDKWDEKVARAIYYEATVLDGTPDDPDAPGGGQQGATVRSGMKALKNRGRLSAYALAVSVADARVWLQTKGPLVFGSDWTNDMFTPSSTGYVKPTGGVAGGHCYIAIADLTSEGAIEFLNSWGDSWGLSGRFKMKYADVATLQSSSGEMWAALEVA